MPSIKIKYDDSAFKKSLAHKMEPIKDMSSAMKACSIYLDRWVQLNFKGEGVNVGGWKPFRLGGRPIPRGGIDTAAKLLQDTGRLKSSFKPFANRINAGIASDLDYSKYHQEGIGVTQRRMLPKKAEVNEDLLRVFKSEVFKNV